MRYLLILILMFCSCEYIPKQEASVSKNDVSYIAKTEIKRTFEDVIQNLPSTSSCKEAIAKVINKEIPKTEEQKDNSIYFILSLLAQFIATLIFGKKKLQFV